MRPTSPIVPVLAIAFGVLLDQSATAQSRSIAGARTTQSTPSLFGSNGPTSQSSLSGSRSGSSGSSSQLGTGGGMVAGTGLVTSTSNATSGFVGRNMTQPLPGEGMNGGTGGFSGQQSRSRNGRNSGTFQRSQSNEWNQGTNGRGFGTAGQQGLQGTAAKPPIQVRHRIGFTPPARSTATISESLGTRITGIAAQRPELTGLDVVVGDAGQVTLRGTVASEEAGRLAAALARLEPGVRSVVNETVVAAPAAQ